MGRLRWCRDCTDNGPLDHPDRHPNRLRPGQPGGVWHDLASWPHGSGHVRPKAPAIHDDASFRKAYRGTMKNGVSDMYAGLGREFETRQEHHTHLKTNSIVESGTDTPTRAGPNPLELARKRGLFQEAVHKAKRGL